MSIMVKRPLALQQKENQETLVVTVQAFTEQSCPSLLMDFILVSELPGGLCAVC